jgi:hypothetical protein
VRSVLQFNFVNFENIFQNPHTDKSISQTLNNTMAGNNQNIVWNEYEINNTKWVVPQRYSNLNPLGQGAYGLVW